MIASAVAAPLSAPGGGTRASARSESGGALAHRRLRWRACLWRAGPAAAVAAGAVQWRRHVEIEHGEGLRKLQGSKKDGALGESTFYPASKCEETHIINSAQSLLVQRMRVGLHQQGPCSIHPPIHLAGCHKIPIRGSAGSMACGRHSLQWTEETAVPCR